MVTKILQLSSVVPRLLYTLFQFFTTALNIVPSSAFPLEEMDAARFVYKHGARGQSQCTGQGHVVLKPMHIPMNLTSDLDAGMMASLVPLETLTWLQQKTHSLAGHVGAGPACRGQVTRQFKFSCC